MNLKTFETSFKHLINIPVKRFNSKGYSKKYGNVSVHEGEYDLETFYYISIDDEVYHISCPFIPSIDKTGGKNKYGIISGSYLVPITENYLFASFIDDYSLIDERGDVLTNICKSTAEEIIDESLNKYKDIYNNHYNSIDEYEIKEEYKIPNTNPTVKEEYDKFVVEDKNDFKSITNSIASLLEYKNAKYGNSALEPLDIFKGKCKVGDTIDHKLARVKNSKVLSKNDIVDITSYLILVCKENNWTNFDEFKD